MRAIDAQLFAQIFGQFDCPVLLKTAQGWLTNPAAQSLCLSPADLEQLEKCESDASLWLARQFYRVSVNRPEGELLLMLHPDTFLASAAENIASQLRDRLSVAFGSTDALSANHALRSDLRARENLSAINQELYRIFHIALQLERCSPSNPLLGQMSQVDMVKWFQLLTGKLEDLCRAAGVEFTAKSDIQALSMPANARQLEYMVSSLVSNSLKNAPKKGGRVTLSMSQDDQVIITITDNAGGVPEDLLARPLWNDPQRLLPRRGLGLGLPLVQRIVADHQGSLMVSNFQQGVQITISLPIRSESLTLGQSEGPDIDHTSGFSLTKILLSNALPRSVYFPNPNEDDE